MQNENNKLKLIYFNLITKPLNMFTDMKSAYFAIVELSILRRRLSHRDSHNDKVCERYIFEETGECL